MNLAERQKIYEEGYDYKIIPSLPIIVKADIRNFIKSIRNLKKPFCKVYWEILRNTMHQTVMDLDGAVISYCHGGEFIFVLRNDMEQSGGLFYGNKVQKVSSIISSLLTSNFMKFYLASEEPPDIIGETIFEVNCFATPSLTETMNYLLYKQQSFIHYAIKYSAYSEISKVYNYDTAKSKLEGKSHAKMKELLAQECNIIFEERYPTYFRRGAISYKTPKIISTDDGEITRKKWHLDVNTPDFIDDRDTIMNILQTGQDIFRSERDLVKR